MERLRFDRAPCVFSSQAQNLQSLVELHVVLACILLPLLSEGVVETELDSPKQGWTVVQKRFITPA